MNPLSESLERVCEITSFPYRIKREGRRIHTGIIGLRGLDDIGSNIGSSSVVCCTEYPVNPVCLNRVAEEVITRDHLYLPVHVPCCSDTCAVTVLV